MPTDDPKPSAVEEMAKPAAEEASLWSPPTGGSGIAALQTVIDARAAIIARHYREAPGLRALVRAATLTCEHLEKPASLLCDAGAARRLRKALEVFHDVREADERLRNK